MVGGAIAGGLAANYFRNLAGSEAAGPKPGQSRWPRPSRRERAGEPAGGRGAGGPRAEADAKAREAKAVADFLVMDLIGAAAPGKGQGTEMTIGEALARADATIDTRFADQPLLAAAIHNQMGKTYWNLDGPCQGRDATSVPRPTCATKHLGPDARETLADPATALSSASGRSGDRRRRERSARTSSSASGARSGPEDADTLVTMAEIG